MSAIILLFFSEFITLSQESCLAKFEDKRTYISSLQDHGKLKQMHFECTKLLELVEKCNCFVSDSTLVDYKLVALFYSIEFFESLKNFKLKDSIMHRIEQIISTNVKMATWANYAYLYYKIKYEDDAQKALQTVKDAEKIILSESTPGGFEKGYTQLNRLKSNIYLKSNNYSLAKASLWSAYGHAKQADKIYDSLYQKSWGYAASILVELLSLPEALFDTKLVEKCLDELVNSKSDYYNSSRHQKIILSLFDLKELQSNQIKILLSSILRKPEYKFDLDINLKAASYFASKNVVEDAIKYYKLSKLSSKLTGFQTAELNLVKANIDYAQKNWKSLSVSLDEWRKNIETVNPFDVLWMKSSIRLSLFKQIKEVSALFAKTYENTNDTSFLNKAIHLYDQAIDGIQIFKNEVSTDEDRIILLGDLITFSEQALRSYHHLYETKGKLDSDKLNNILNYFELNKSFNLLINQSLNSDKFSLEEMALKTSYEKAIASLEQQIGTNPEHHDVLNHQLEEYKSKLTDLINSKQLKIRRLNLIDIQNSLEDDHSIMEFFSGHSDLFCLLINKNNVTFKRLGSDTIKGLNGNLIQYKHLNKDLADEFSSENLIQYKKYSYDFYQLMIKPFQHELAKNVIIIADGDLATLAWCSLISTYTDLKNPAYWQYLIYDYKVNVQPSIALWLKLNTYLTERKKISFVSFAPEFKDLKYNVEEAKVLAGLFPASKRFINSNATLENFNEYAPDSKIIHIASHARGGTDLENDLSRIVLQNDTIYSNEIEGIRFNSELAFLSACETGLGKVIHAEGVMSLARAFFGAGVKAVISTLWEVNDKISKEQVVTFYKNLLQGQSKADAIRNMQLNYLSNVERGQNALPYYWASYQCQGNMDAIFKPTSNQLFKVLSLLPIVSFSFIGLTFYFLRKSIQQFNL